MTEMSRAIRMQSHGSADVLEWVDVPVTEPGPQEVRVRHHALGINYIDIYFRTGLYPQTLPGGLGQEASGVVEAVGTEVKHLKVGDRVAYATNLPGSYAEHRTLNAAHVCVLPDDISFETGAAMMLKGLTAQYLLLKCKPVEGLNRGDQVLFHAAAGGVGLLACQWARALGYELIGTTGSDDKCDLAREFGAAHTINYRTQNFVEEVKRLTQGQGVKVVYDSVGKDTWEGSLDCLRPFGLMVSFGNSSGAVPAFAPGVLGPKGSLYVTRQTLFTHLRTRESTQQMADALFEVVRKGQVKIPITRTYSMEQLREAHVALESRATTGCMIVTMT